MAEQKKDKTAAKAASTLVRVRVNKAVAFAGLRVGPDIDDQGKVTPVEAVIPRTVYDGQRKDRLELLGDAPDDAKVGLVEDK